MPMQAEQQESEADTRLDGPERPAETGKSALKALLQGALILAISNVVLKAINFFLLPLYTAYLTPEQLGINDAIANFTSLVYTLLVLSFDAAFSAFYYDKPDESHRQSVLSTVWFTLFGTSLVAMLLALFAEPLSIAIFGTQDYAMALRLSLMGVVLNLWWLPFSLDLRVRSKMGLYSIGTLTAATAMIASQRGVRSGIQDGLLLPHLEFSPGERAGTRLVRPVLRQTPARFVAVRAAAEEYVPLRHPHDALGFGILDAAAGKHLHHHGLRHHGRRRRLRRGNPLLHGSQHDIERVFHVVYGLRLSKGQRGSRRAEILCRHTQHLLRVLHHRLPRGVASWQGDHRYHGSVRICRSRHAVAGTYAGADVLRTEPDIEAMAFPSLKSLFIWPYRFSSPPRSHWWRTLSQYRFWDLSAQA